MTAPARTESFADRLSRGYRSEATRAEKLFTTGVLAGVWFLLLALGSLLTF